LVINYSLIVIEQNEALSSKNYLPSAFTGADMPPMKLMVGPSRTGINSSIVSGAGENGANESK
jgi:hypothetical protein